MPPQYLSTDPNAGQDTQPKYLSTDPNAGLLPKPAATISRGEGETARVLDAAVNSKFPYIHPIDAAEVATEGLPRANQVTHNADQMSNIIGTMGLLDTGASATEAIPKMGSAIGTLLDDPSAITNRIAEFAREPATARQSQLGKAGTVRVPRLIRDWAIPDWAVPKGELGTPTNPGPFREFISRASRPAELPKPLTVPPPPVRWRQEAEPATVAPPPVKWRPEETPTPVAAPPVKWREPEAALPTRSVAAPPVKWRPEEPTPAPKTISAPPVKWRPEETPAAARTLSGEIGASERERAIGSIISKDVLSPEDVRTLNNYGVRPPRPGEPLTKYRNSIVGDLKADRARTEGGR